MEYANASPEIYRQYGESHGCAIFYSQEETDSFIDHIQARLGANFEPYMRGFAAGVSGEFDETKYQHMKGLAPNEQKTETAEG
jgi:hypothetical protein